MKRLILFLVLAVGSGVAQINNGGSGGGSGTVSVKSSGNLTDSAIVTGGGTTLVQTPDAGTTLDSNGNLVTGAVTTGAGLGYAGWGAIGAGTDAILSGGGACGGAGQPPCFPLNSFAWLANPTITSSWAILPPTSYPTAPGIMHAAISIANSSGLFESQSSIGQLGYSDVPQGWFSSYRDPRNNYVQAYFGKLSSGLSSGVGTHGNGIVWGDSTSTGNVTGYDSWFMSVSSNASLGVTGRSPLLTERLQARIPFGGFGGVGWIPAGTVGAPIGSTATTCTGTCGGANVHDPSLHTFCPDDTSYSLTSGDVLHFKAANATLLTAYVLTSASGPAFTCSLDGVTYGSSISSSFGAGFGTGMITCDTATLTGSLPTEGTQDLYLKASATGVLACGARALDTAQLSTWTGDKIAVAGNSLYNQNQIPLAVFNGFISAQTKNNIAVNDTTATLYAATPFATGESVTFDPFGAHPETFTVTVTSGTVLTLSGSNKFAFAHTAPVHVQTSGDPAFVLIEDYINPRDHCANSSCLSTGANPGRTPTQEAADFHTAKTRANTIWPNATVSFVIPHKTNDGTCDSGGCVYTAQAYHNAIVDQAQADGVPFIDFFSITSLDDMANWLPGVCPYSAPGIGSCGGIHLTTQGNIYEAAVAESALLNNEAAPVPTTVVTGTDIGAANAYIIGSSLYGALPLSLHEGQVVIVAPAHANSGASTMVLGGLASKSITKCGSTALASGDLSTTSEATMIYNGTSYELLNPQSVGCGSASSAFNGISSGTNTTATMVVGAGASLAPTSATAGVVSANQIVGVGGQATVGQGVGGIVYDPSVCGSTCNSTHSSIGSQTATTVPTGNACYRMTIIESQVDVGTGCSGNGSVSFSVTYSSEANNSINNSTVLGTKFNATTTAGFATSSVLSNTTVNSANDWFWSSSFCAKAGTTVTWSSTYTAGASCSTGQNYIVRPFLTLLNVNGN